MPTLHHTSTFGPWDSNDDFDRCPPTIQRKFFSSLERLRLQEATAARSKSSAGRSSSGLARSSSRKRLSRPTLARHNSSYFQLPTRRPTCSHYEPFSPSDAYLFVNLPEKIRRNHFTAEERQRLSRQQYEPAFFDAADKHLYKQSLGTNQSVPNLRPSSPSSLSSLSTFDASEQPVDSAVDMDESAFDGFRWIENEDDHDLASTLQLDQYHEFIHDAAQKNENSSLPKRQPSFRRTLSMTSLPFPQRKSQPMQASRKSTLTTSFVSPTAPQLPATILPKRKPSRSILKPTSTNDRLPSSASITPSNLGPKASHYTDPCARLKLRVYLASPQKFDEAIEFGFPSMEDKESMSMPRASMQHARNDPHQYKAPCVTTFLNTDSEKDDPASSALDDDSATFCVDDDDDSASLSGRHSPYTPPEANFPDTYLLSPSEVPSSGSSSGAFFPHGAKRSYSNFDEPLQSPNGKREMTLRMTLTRPDLRADEKELYPTSGTTYPSDGVQSNRDPLALDHLPVEGMGKDASSPDFWDSLPDPKQEGVIKRVWRKVSGGGFCR